MSVYKDILARVSGLPFDVLLFNNGKIVEIKDNITRQQEELSLLTNQLLDSLHHFNVSSNNTKLQQNIQSYRRALFKKTNYSLNDEFSCLLPKEIKTQIESLLFEKTKLERLFEHFDLEYELNVLNEREAIKKHISNDLFLNGVRMSSLTLHKSILKYISEDHSSPTKKDQNTEKGILKYLSRTASKTSPFSTLTSLAIAKVSTIPLNKSLSVSNQMTKVTGVLRINNLVQQHFRKLLLSDKELVRHFSLRANSTLVMTKLDYTYLINKNNVEIFQKIGRDPVIDCIIFEVKKRGSIYFIDFIKLLKENVNASKNSLEQYLNKCLEIGLLEVELGVSGIDSFWPKTLDFMLKKEFPTPPRKIKLLLKTLEFLSDVTEKHANATFKEKERLFSKAHALFDINASKLATPSKNADGLQQKKQSFFKKEQLFFEDSKNDLVIEFDKQQIDNIGSLLFEFHQNIDILDLKLQEQQMMFKYFEKKYEGQSTIPLLSFYESYYRDIKIIDQIKFKKGEENLVENDKEFFEHIIEQRVIFEKKRSQWNDIIWKQLNFNPKEGSDIFLTGEMIESANHEVNFIVDKLKKRSVSSFLHLSLDKNNYNTVVTNSVFSGYGKMYSRFLHLFAKEVTESLKKNNLEKQSKNTIFAELQDGSFHNANLHPPLLNYEIRIPGGHKSLPEKRQILVSDINVVIDLKNQTLKLIYKKNNKQIFPFDLGFQGGLGRSKLFALLNNFAYANHNASTYLTSYLNYKIRELSIDKGYIRLPRVFFEKKICLQRNIWIVETSSIPTKKTSESDSSYFLNIQLWRDNLSLPDYVFIRLKINAISIDQKYPDSMGKDDYKPQLINFNSVLFVNLFDKLIKKSADYIQIEEMLPNQEQLMETSSGKFVVEYYLQADNG